MSDQLGILGWKKTQIQRSLGVMGRFSDEGNYTVDIDEGTLSNVRQIRIADFIKDVVASRRWVDSFGLYWFPLNHCLVPWESHLLAINPQLCDGTELMKNGKIQMKNCTIQIICGKSNIFNRNQ